MSSAENETPESDGDLMVGIAKGNEESLSELYERYGKIVFAVCMRALGNRNEAEEVTSKVFWEIWERSERYNSTRGSVQAYVLTIARSRAVDRLRSKQTPAAETSQIHLDAVPIPGGDSFDPSDRLVFEERRLAMKQAIEALDPSQREAIELAFFGGLTHREVAEKLGRPLGTVKAHIRKGLTCLRQCLNEFEKGR
jgi:RNA polymerase sigma-70 factor (ECF subfamily)